MRFLHAATGQHGMQPLAPAWEHQRALPPTIGQELGTDIIHESTILLCFARIFDFHDH
jgi:hypothetical protein